MVATTFAMVLAASLVGGPVGCAGSAPDGKPALPKGPVGLRFRDLDGELRTLGSLRGHVVIVHVFTTWSGPALLDVPRLVQLAESEPERVRIVGLVMDREPETASIFAETFDVPYIVGHVLRPEWFLSPDGPFGPITIMPTSIVLDRAGRVVARSDGTWAPGVLESLVGRLL